MNMPGSPPTAPDSVGVRTDGLLDRFVNGLVDGLTSSLEFGTTTVVVDYALWNLRYWLPRAAVWRGYAAVGDDINPSGVVPPVMPVTFDLAFEVEDIRERGTPASPGMPASAADAIAKWSEPEDSIGIGPGDSPGWKTLRPHGIVTIIPRDLRSLAASDLLPRSIWETGLEGMDDGRLKGIAAELSAVGTGDDRPVAVEEVDPWTFYPPVKTVWLLRYNAVEGISVGTRLRRDFGSGRGTLTVRMGTKSFRPPDLRFALSHRRAKVRVQASVYRSLAGVGVVPDKLGGSFAFGTDAEDYFWVNGASLQLAPTSHERSWLSLSLFSERHTAVGGGIVRARFGIQSDWRPWWGGMSRQSFSLGGHAAVRGVAGDNPHLKATVTGVLIAPLGGRISLGLEGGGARVWGNPLPRDLWPLGATGTWLRGHAGVLRTPIVWRGRADLHGDMGPLRFSVFGDWAAAAGTNHYAMGLGLGVLGGLIRVDLGHGFKLESTGWLEPSRFRLHVSTDSFF